MAVVRALLADSRTAPDKRAIHDAAGNGHASVVYALLAAASFEGAAVYNSALFNAVSSRRVDAAVALLVDGRTDPVACGVVYCAAYYGLSVVVRAALRDNRPDLLRGRNRAGLHAAAVKGHVECVRALIADGRSDAEVQGVHDALVSGVPFGRVVVAQPMWALLKGAVRWRRRRPWLLCAAEDTAPGKMNTGHAASHTSARTRFQS